MRQEREREEQQPRTVGNAPRGGMAPQRVAGQEQADADQEVRGGRMAAQEADARHQGRQQRAQTTVRAAGGGEEEQAGDQVKRGLVAQRPRVLLGQRQRQDPREQEKVREELQRVLRLRRSEPIHAYSLQGPSENVARRSTMKAG